MWRSIASSFLLLSAIANASQILLPKPNGTYDVGVGIMELIDRNHVQPFAPTVQPRALMVSLFYPVVSHGPTEAVNYMPPETALFEDLEMSSVGLKTPNGTFEQLALQLAGEKSRSHLNNSESRFPIVLFSPGEATTRLFYSVIAQTVASSGYIVVTIDAPYDVDIVEYPNGDVALINATVVAASTLADIETATLARAQDASFVLDQLKNASVVSQLIPGSSKGLNVSKVAMFGHSLGGAATAAAMLNDSRIAGGLAMDGALFGPVVKKGLDRPFMFMAHTNHTRSDNNTSIDPYNSWFDIWPKLTGWKLDIQLANSAHYTFTDYPIVWETLGLKPNATVEAGLLVTSLNGARALHIVTTYAIAFLDLVMKCTPSPILQGPVASFPEVSFER